MELNLLISFFGASILLALMPGPDNIFVLTESITKGSRNGIALTLGLSSGILIHTTAAATGLSFLIQESAIAFSILKYLGAVYLLFLAYKASKDQPLKIKVAEKSPKESFGKLIRKGFLMNVLNPKVSLFFIAFLPQFISKTGFPIIYQMMVLGLIFIIVSILIFGSVALLSGRLAPYLNSSKFWNITKWGKISVLSILGISLALSNK
jgi:threonine/homoserine/homoserine lactone efflux protein